jgi:Tol biopolymer transport system component
VRVQSRWVLVALVAITGLGDGIDAGGAGPDPARQGPPGQGLALPPNLEADPVFHPFLDKMLQSSATFRNQCDKLAAAATLRVRAIVEEQPQRDLLIRARTELTRQAGSLEWARVYLPSSPDAIELIAHEVEHILEQLDCVDLAAQAGNGVVWKSGEQRFETRRAIEVGQRVAREVATAAVASGGRKRAPAGFAARLTTAVQRDPHATPSSQPSARVSGNGRFVVFSSPAALVDADHNRFQDIYVRDLETGLVTLESAGPDGVAGNGDSVSPGISSDGRYVVFESQAGNITGRTAGAGDAQVFLRDRERHATRLLTANPRGAPANGPSRNPAISGDATTVVFESFASDLIEPGHAPRNAVGVYLIRPGSGLRTRIDRPVDRDAGGGQGVSPAISDDGRFVAFMSRVDLTCSGAPACTVEPKDKNRVADIYLRDTKTNSTRRVSRTGSGRDPDGPSYHPAISGDGRYVAFVSEASNLTPDSKGGVPQVYVTDLVTGVADLISRTPPGRPANGASARPVLSLDGSMVAYQSVACDLLCQGDCRTEGVDINLLWDVFLHDRRTRRTIRASSDDGEDWLENSRAPSLDAAGGVLVFGSRHPIGIPDRGHDEDLYIAFLSGRR